MYKPSYGQPFVGVRLPSPMLAAAKQHAADTGTTLSGLIRDSLADRLDKAGIDWHNIPSEPIDGQTTLDDAINA